MIYEPKGMDFYTEDGNLLMSTQDELKLRFSRMYIMFLSKILKVYVGKKPTEADQKRLIIKPLEKMKEMLIFDGKPIGELEFKPLEFQLRFTPVDIEQWKKKPME